MSLGDSRIPTDNARRRAEKELRLKVGNLPHLGDMNSQNDRYVFPVKISLPVVIYDSDEDEPVDVKFLSEDKVGEIAVDAETGEIADKTPLSTINDRIEEKKKEVERAIQRALIKSSAEKFSLLSYAEHRNTPEQDLLAEVILTGEIELGEIHSLKDKDTERYLEKIETLVSLDLLRKEDGEITAGDELIKIQKSQDEPSDALNEAMAYFLRERAEDIDAMVNILGPFLELAGYYYRRAIESDGLPKVSRQEFRKQLAQRDSSGRRKIKRFKLSGYLLQLEEVGILKSTSNYGDRAWKGDKKIKQNMLEQQDQLGPVAQIVS